MKINNAKLIQICILAYTGIAVFAIQLGKQWEFWVLAVCVGLFQGGIQALSRSYFAQIIPPENAGEFFGLFDICGKGAAFLGTALVSMTAQISGNANESDCDSCGDVYHRAGLIQPQGARRVNKKNDGINPSLFG